MKKIFCVFLTLLSLNAIAQDDVPLLTAQTASTQKFVNNTFNDTRLVNFQSVDVVGRNVLEAQIQHRFGEINTGARNYFGFDNVSSIRLGLSYSYDGRLEAGIGRSSYEKLVDGYLKYRLMRQTNDGYIPLSLTLFGGMYCTTQPDPNAALNGYNEYHYFSDRLSYSFEAIVARRFSNRLSLQVSPTYLHYNMVVNITDKNDIAALGFAGKYTFRPHMSLLLEYALKYNAYTRQTYYNSLGVGWEMQTSGHIFQVLLTNSGGIAEPQYIAQTTTAWQKGGIRLGFNITRAFGL